MRLMLLAWQRRVTVRPSGVAGLGTVSSRTTPRNQNKRKPRSLTLNETSQPLHAHA